VYVHPCAAESILLVEDRRRHVATDRRLLPRRHRAWASWNYHLLDEPTGRTTVTYYLNRLQALSAEREFCVTLNRTSRIDPDTVIKRIRYAPLVQPGGVRA